MPHKISLAYINITRYVFNGISDPFQPLPKSSLMELQVLYNILMLQSGFTSMTQRCKFLFKMAATHQHLILFATIIVVIWVTTRIVHAEFMYKSYQHSITCYSQHPPRSPRSLTEIQDILRYAIAYDMPIKVLGNRHSISDSICTSGIPINMTNIKHFAYDPTSTIAKVGAGMEVGDFLVSKIVSNY